MGELLFHLARYLGVGGGGFCCFGNLQNSKAEVECETEPGKLRREDISTPW